MSGKWGKWLYTLHFSKINEEICIKWEKGRSIEIEETYTGKSKGISIQNYQCSGDMKKYVHHSYIHLVTCKENHKIYNGFNVLYNTCRNHITWKYLLYYTSNKDNCRWSTYAKQKIRKFRVFCETSNETKETSI